MRPSQTRWLSARSTSTAASRGPQPPDSPRAIACAALQAAGVSGSGACEEVGACSSARTAQVATTSLSRDALTTSPPGNGEDSGPSSTSAASITSPIRAGLARDGHHVAVVHVPVIVFRRVGFVPLSRFGQEGRKLGSVRELAAQRDVAT